MPATARSQAEVPRQGRGGRGVGGMSGTDPVLMSRALEVAGRLANDAAEVITATAGRGVAPDTTVSPYDWVTDTDRTLERHTRRVLSSEFPGIPVLGGESDALVDQPDLPGAGGPPLLWVVDPVDGTANYLAGLPWCGYSLSLLDVAGPLVGVIADPYQAQIYAAARGRGLRANGHPVRPLPDRDRPVGLAGALICTEWSHGTDPSGLAARCRGVGVGLRVLGSAALAVTQVSLGRAVAAVLQGYRLWDVAAAIALAAEAGAWIGAPDGVRAILPPDGLVVAAPDMVGAVLELLEQGPDGPDRPSDGLTDLVRRRT